MRNKIGYVLQEPLYFQGTIKENITLNVDYSNSRLTRVIHEAELDDVVKDKGLDKTIFSFGSELSGGQLQRINIARELIKNPDVLIFDEATSALDTSTEFDIIQTMKKLKRERTILIVSHRMSVVEHCDVLFDLDKGRLKQVN